MLIYLDGRLDAVRFGVDILITALKEKGKFFVEKPLKAFLGGGENRAIVLSLSSDGVRAIPEALEIEGFEIVLEQQTIFITAKDASGLMYGTLDVAETIEHFGVESIKDKIENPCMKMRGIKFNLPFEPYDNGDPFEKNVETCKDIDFWRDYIDFLAKNRYNCLSLWSEHPFHMMFRLPKYPDACPYSEVELEKYKNLYKFIFSYAKSRGISTYLITWNIRITPFVARALGLPEELGDMSDSYESGNPNIKRTFLEVESDAIRQHLEVIKDYLKECIKTLLMTYKDLTGIGTSCGEEMVGKSDERQKWVSDVYLEAVKECGRHVPFTHRTNAGNAKVTKELFINKYPGTEKYISWKYSNAHMYSHPEPQFEKISKVWEGLEFDNFKVIYTVRNDDFHTLRWGDPEYIKAYINGMNRPHVAGFYWGADGYVWGEDFQHVNHKHKTWKYDFERHWMEFELLGRLGYNPELHEEVWIAKFKKRYGEPWGQAIFEGLKASSKIIPAVNRLNWISYDFEWHPESLLSLNGFKSVIDFMNGESMPLSGTISLREFAEKESKGEVAEGETPLDILTILSEAVNIIHKISTSLREMVPEEYLDGDILCTLLDIEAWGELGTYYHKKFSAALELLRFKYSKDVKAKERAVVLLKEALEAWKRLAHIGSMHYLPYKMARTKQLFGWSYYIDEVERDIKLGEGYTG